ncbi:MAG: DUF3267 domain-containing protein [Bacteroidota bacterium]|nr:DUF3267 domain-containing protein [Bacteroidota bacterium]MDX5429667.1 DUF3267 domain-containing protein [Bacteroidota bacterium]MDX5468445.1 DUF3267 domain-containing protein [Bacteroidota bacterium]
MNLKPEELEDQGYVLLDSMEHDDILPLITAYLKKRNLYSICYYLCNALLFGISLYYFLIERNSTQMAYLDLFSYFSYGIGIALALIPLHEYIHVLAYKTQGAQHTSYDVNLKKFYFLALADKFIANRKEFRFVALAPFMTISSLLLVMLFFVNGPWHLTVLGTLLIHTTMCSGDFGLLSYMEFHREKGIVTYDNVQERISYFYVKGRQ